MGMVNLENFLKIRQSLKNHLRGLKLGQNTPLDASYKTLSSLFR